MRSHCLDSLFFFNDTATTEIYTLSLHDALPIFVEGRDRLLLIIDHALQVLNRGGERVLQAVGERGELAHPDRKSTRLNSSHSQISYAVFCLKKKNNRTYSQYA